jgi:D-alanyl-D-alanine dipeptidase
MREPAAASEDELPFFTPHAAAPPDTYGETIGAVNRVPIRDNGEPLVDPREYNWSIAVASRHPWARFPRSPWVRESVGRMLGAAQSSLPTGVRILIIEGYRRLEVQRSLFVAACKLLRRRHPDWSEEHLREGANCWVAAPDIAAPPPHTTGGAVDLTLVDAEERWLDMTGPEGWTELTAPTASLAIPEQARANRRILCEALAAAGLTNYPGEWWHWSYGEPGWAVRTGQSHAIYGAVEAQIQWEI